MKVQLLGNVELKHEKSWVIKDFVPVIQSNKYKLTYFYNKKKYLGYKTIDYSYK